MALRDGPGRLEAVKGHGVLTMPSSRRLTYGPNLTADGAPRPANPRLYHHPAWRSSPLPLLSPFSLTPSWSEKGPRRCWWDTAR